MPGTIDRSYLERQSGRLKSRGLPAASTTRGFVDAGGLMSYGADGPVLFRHSTKFVHRILQGKQPNELPIEQPTKFELAINLKTAKVIGLTIPEAFCFGLIHCSNEEVIFAANAQVRLWQILLQKSFCTGDQKFSGL